MLSPNYGQTITGNFGIFRTFYRDCRIRKVNIFLSKSDKFEKFKSIQWFDINNRQKKAILQQFKRQRKFQVHFYEYGITFKTHNGTETMPIRTLPFPILNLY